MMDKQEYLHDSLIQHGKSNDRIYLMSYHPDSREELYKDLLSLAEKEKYGKIFIKISKQDKDFFQTRGFTQEAIIPRYYPKSDCVLMTLYLNNERKKIPKEESSIIENVLQLSVRTNQSEDLTNPVSSFSFKALSEKHVNDMADIYRQVFASYPFPIHDTKYLQETMRSHVFYFGCFKDEKLIAVSSAETDKKTGSVEMTDFAVLPDYRGFKLAYRLLLQMEDFVCDKGFRTAYTIARAISYGMNKTFANADYSFGGTLVNNTQICGQIESMNVWYKDLKPCNCSSIEEEPKPPQAPVPP